MRRRYLIAVVALVVLVAAAAIGLGVWIAGGDGDGPTKQDYLADVSSACHSYARRLARVPAPANVTAYGDVVSSVRQVLPLLRRQAAAMQAIEPPEELRPRAERLFALDRQSVAALRATLAAAERRDAGGVIEGLSRFTAARDKTHAFAVTLGVRC